MAEVFTEEFEIIADDFPAAGEASARIKSILKRIGIEPALIRRVTIAAYEAEMKHYNTQPRRYNDASDFNRQHKAVL